MTRRYAPLTLLTAQAAIAGAALLVAGGARLTVLGMGAAAAIWVTRGRASRSFAVAVMTAAAIVAVLTASIGTPAPHLRRRDLQHHLTHPVPRSDRPRPA